MTENNTVFGHTIYLSFSYENVSNFIILAPEERNRDIQRKLLNEN